MDDLKTIRQNVDTQINPAGASGSILAANHNALLKSVIDSVGKFTGFIFNAIDSGNTSNGLWSWNTNAMDNTSAFDIIVSKFGVDGQDIGLVVDKLSAGDFIKFKDFVGRTALLKINTITSGQDSGLNNIYTINVEGYTQNTSYTYITGDSETCVVEFLSVGSIKAFTTTNPEIHKDPTNSSPLAIPEKNDLVRIRISQTEVITGIYRGDSLPLLDPASYQLLDSETLPTIP